MRRIAATGVAALCLLVASCSSTADLGRDAPGTDYVPGATYVLLQDRYLEYQGWPPKFGRPEIVASSVAHVDDGPSSIEAFLADPSRWPRIVGVLPAGTRLRLKEIVKHRHPMLDDWFQATGVVEDGKFQGQEVELLRISAGSPDSRMLRVDPDELRRVTPDPEVTQGP